MAWQVHRNWMDKLGAGETGGLFPKEGAWQIYNRSPPKPLSKINPQIKEIQFNKKFGNRTGSSRGENSPLHLNIGPTPEASAN